MKPTSVTRRCVSTSRSIAQIEQVFSDTPGPPTASAPFACSTVSEQRAASRWPNGEEFTGECN